MAVKIRIKRSMNNILMWHVFAKIVREQSTVCCHITDADAHRRIAGVVGVEFNPYSIAYSVKRTISEHSHTVIAARLEFREVPSLIQLVVGTGQFAVFIINTSKSIVLAGAPSDECGSSGK